MNIINKAFCLLFLIILLPLLVCTSILVFFFIDKKIFFIQDRVGLKNKVFRCYKFATLLDNKTADQNLKFSTINGRKINIYGIFLRKYFLDELPQIFNILKGEMSFVGPRPHSLIDHKHFNEQIKFYNKRHAVLPGITGLAQVNKFNGHVKNKKMLKKRIAYDILYIKKKSLIFDVGIIINTLVLILFKKNYDKD